MSESVVRIYGDVLINVTKFSKIEIDDRRIVFDETISILLTSKEQAKRELEIVKFALRSYYNKNR